MGDGEEFERTEYEELQDGQSGSEFQGAQNDLRVNPYCGTGDCTNDEEDPAESAWIRLMSAVPQANQISGIHAAREGTMLLPPGETIQTMVASLRPQPEADYALDTIRDKWSEFYNLFREIGPTLEAKLADLADAWKGDDYDGFEEQTQTVIRNCKTIAKDIGGEDGTEGVIKVLDDKQLEIYNQQGGMAIVYPAPKFFLENTGCGSQAIHIRPPFYQTCEIKANDETKEAVELAGFDPGIVDEIHDGRTEEYNRWMDYLQNNPDYEEDGRSGSELAEYKADQWADQALEDMGNDGQEILQAQAAEVNEEVTDHENTTNMAVTEIEPDHEKGEQTAFNEGGEVDKPGSGGLDTGGGPGGPGGGGMPDLGGGGLDGMNKPGDLSDLGGGLNNGGNNGPGDLGDLDNGGLDGLDDSPWEPGTTDPDDISGGLAGGPGLGGGIGGGPGLGGSGGGLGGGAGGGIGGGAGGIGGGMMGAGGMGRGAGGAGAGRGGMRGAGGMGAGKGAGAGAGAGRGGRGMTGMMGGGGARGMGGTEDQDGKETWLTEDDDVWGIGNEDEDPYA